MVEQLALLAICFTSAHFMAVCGPEIESIPLPSPCSKFVCLSEYLNLISFLTKNVDDILLVSYVPLVYCLVKCLLEVDLSHVPGTGRK